MISDLIVIYRALGSQDESASLEEQADKVLYFKQDISINAQLSQLTLVEGLIEFTTKFSKQNIKTAVLDRKIWCFYEPEPDVWIVSSHPIMANGVYPAQNSQGLYDALQETYRAYHLLFGKIADSVDLEHFATIQKQRKRLRKAKQAIYTAQQDTDITEDVINDIFDSDKDYHSLPETLITLFEDYSQAKDTLTTSLSSTRYNIPPLRNQLSAFLNWHASFWSAAEGSFLAGIPKTINPHLTGFSKAALVHRILRVISQQIDDSLLLGTFIAHDGAVLWSDFAPHSTSSLSHLLCQLDCSHLLALKELSDDYLMGGNTSSTTGNSANMSSSSTPSMRGRVDDIEEVRRDAKARMFQDILNDRISRQGVATCDWRSLSLEDPSIALSLGSIKSSTSFTLSASAKQRIGPAAFLEGIPTADGREKVLLPRLFLHREAELREICGRGLVILLGRLVIIIVLDPQVLEAYRREEIARTLQFCRSEVEGISRTGSVSLAHFLRCLTSPVPQATTNECGSTSNDDETLRAVQIALLSHQLAATLALETRLFKKQAASTLESAMGSTGASVFGGDGSLLNGNGRGARVDTTRESNYLTRRTSAISPGLPLPPAFSPTSASPPPTPFSAPTASVNVNTAIATGSTNNAFCGALLTRGDVIFFTWRPGAELRVWSSRDLVDVLVGAATSSGPGGAAMGGAVSDGLGDITTSGALPPSATSSSSKTPAEGMLEALVRKYSQLRSPHLLFYLLIAGLYGRSTARILNGLHTQLRRSRSVWECQRVATAQKGGLWAVGHRLTTASRGDSDSILLGVARQCATINDLHDLLDGVVREVRLLAV